MKKLSVLRAGAGFLAIAVAGLPPAPAQVVPQNQILQNKADQADVRLHTAAVADQIQSLVDELAANGISGDDTQVLNATKVALTNLSGPEMDRVISSLQKAAEPSNPASKQQNAVNAYADQKEIILQFRQILRDYEQRQAAYELPVRFKELSAKQTETMLASANVARATAGKSASELTGMQQTTEQIVQADQEAIGNEVNLAEEQLNKAAQGSSEEDAKALHEAQKEMAGGVLQQALNQANTDLKAGHLLQAINDQKTARDELRQIAQDLNPPTTAVAALTANAASLDKLIEKQKNLLDQTKAATAGKPPVTGLDDKQGALVDETNSLQQDMKSLSPTVASLVKDAITPMQMSRAALTMPPGKPAPGANAAPSQQEAIAKLEEAQKQLQQQVADAQKAADDATKNPVAKLQDLQKQIQSAMQKQEQLNNPAAQVQTNAGNPAPPKASDTAQAQQQQSELQQQTAALQKTAQPLSLPASQALAKAADQMNEAQKALSNPADPANAAQAQAAQQAAKAALAQANQQVGQQIAKAQQKAPDPAALASAATSLQKAQTSVSAALAAAKPSPSAASNAPTPAATPKPPAGSPPKMAEAAAALAAAAQHTQDAAATPGLPSAAAAAVKEAQAAIAQGEQQAAKDDAPGTASSAATAEQSLAQAQAAVAMAQAGLASAAAPAPGTTPGGPPEPGTDPHPPGPDKPGKDGAKDLTGGSTDKGTLHGASGDGKFVSVASRDRAAIDQAQAEKRPQEYAPLIDQYMKNLSDQSSAP